MGHPLQTFFSKVRIFSALNTEELNDLLRAIQPVTLSAGDHLFRQGDPGDALYVVQEGQLEIYVQDEDRDITLAVLEKGAVLGEVALLDGAPRSASVRAQADTELFRLDRGEFDFLRRNLRPAAYQVIRAISQTLCARIRASDEQLSRVLSGEDEEVTVTKPPATPRNRWMRRLFTRGGA